MTSNLNYDVAQ